MRETTGYKNPRQSEIRDLDMPESSETLPVAPPTESVAEAGLIAAAEIASTEAQHSPVSDEQMGIWSAIRESLRGSHRDYTVGPIGRSVILLAIPMVLE